jgi:hypothetical protein
MEFLRAVGRFILAQFVILGFLLLAPAVLVGVSLYAIAGGFGGEQGYLAFFYFAAGPFVSGAWTMIVLHVRNVHRIRKATGVPYKTDLKGHLSVWGFLFYGFFGTLAAEVAFYFAFSAVSKSVAVFFALAPFVVFSPLIAWLIVGGGLKSAVRRMQYRRALAKIARFSESRKASIKKMRGMNSFEEWSRRVDAINGTC